jgi:hypothetical protein
VAGSGKNGTQEGAWWAGLTAFVAEQLWAGRSTHEVIRALEERGLDRRTAEALAAQVEEELREGGAL